jgi:hypothetical protein
MAKAARFKVDIGDLLEIDGRLYDVVPDKQRGATLEPAITMTALPIGLAVLAGALADWEDIDEVVREIYASRRRSRDRTLASLK